jgi:hypothetical protein
MHVCPEATKVAKATPLTACESSAQASVDHSHLLNLSVLKDEHRCLAPELGQNTGKVRTSRCTDMSTRRSPASQINFADMWVRAKGFASERTKARDDIEDARWQTAVGEDLSQLARVREARSMREKDLEHSDRSELRWFQDDGVPCRQSWGNFFDGNEHRVVPGGELNNNTQRDPLH